MAGIVLIYWFYLYQRDAQISFTAILLWALLFRLIGIFGEPLLEDDFYRYLLDGCLFISEGSPYGIAPSSLFLDNDLSPQCRETLNWINNPDIPTIYGPLLQYVFAAAHLASPANIDLLQIIVVLFDVGVILLLKNLARPRSILLYAWNPLVIKEIAFTAHPDIIGVYLLLAAFIALQNQRVLKSSVLIALACCAKIFALLALPFFLYGKPLKYWAITLAVIFLAYLPFLFQGQTDLLVVGLFVERWEFNPTFFAAIKTIIQATFPSASGEIPLATPDNIARLICLLGFIAWYAHYFFLYQRRRQYQPDQPIKMPRMEWVFGMFFLFSPVVNAWYLIWLLPFAVMHRCYWAWAVSLVIGLSYITGLNLIESNLGAYEIAAEARVIEFFALSLALWFDWRSGHLKSAPIQPD